MRRGKNSNKMDWVFEICCAMRTIYQQNTPSAVLLCAHILLKGSLLLLYQFPKLPFTQHSYVANAQNASFS